MHLAPQLFLRAPSPSSPAFTSEPEGAERTQTLKKNKAVERTRAPAPTVSRRSYKQTLGSREQWIRNSAPVVLLGLSKFAARVFLSFAFTLLSTVRNALAALLRLALPSVLPPSMALPLIPLSGSPRDQYSELGGDGCDEEAALLSPSSSPSPPPPLPATFATPRRLCFIAFEIGRASCRERVS